MEDPIHPWRWRLVIVWIVIFTAVVFWALSRQLSTTDELKKDKASLLQLQATNCGLEKFLLTARRTRWDAYRLHHSKADLEAVIGYERLVQPFFHGGHATGDCPVPSRILIKARPIDDLR